MKQAIAEPRPDLSPYAPRITSFLINVDKIREVIGAGGKVINEIIDATGVTIDIEDDGLVVVCGTDAEQSEKAVAWIKDIVREIEPGEVFKGKVTRLMDFGAFVEVLPGREGMVHVSELAPYRVEKPSDFVNSGDEVTVKVKEIDDQGRVNLTMLGLDANQPLWQDSKGKSSGPGGFRPRSGRPGGHNRFGNRSRRPHSNRGFQNK
jgi:polyribonucleotide nucleotidyltransferase